MKVNAMCHCSSGGICLGLMKKSRDHDLRRATVESIQGSRVGAWTQFLFDVRSDAVTLFIDGFKILVVMEGSETEKCADGGRWG